MAATVHVWFDTTEGDNFFTIEHPTLGRLDTGGVLAGDIATDITAFVAGYSIVRGRSSELDDIDPGTCNLELLNHDGRFLPDAFAGGTAGPYGVGNVAPGRRIEVAEDGHTVFAGWTGDLTLGYRPGDESASWDAADSLAGLPSFSEWTATAGQRPGERLAAVLDRPEVDWGPNRNLDAGVNTLQGDFVSWGSSVLNYCQLVAGSDLGRFFASRADTLTFRDRLSVAAAAPKVRFADDGTGVGFAGAGLRYGWRWLFSDVSVDREGGVAQTVTVQATRDRFNTRRRLDVGPLLLDSDAASADMAEFLSGIYSQPRPEFESLAVTVDDGDPVAAAAVNLCDIGDVVEVAWTPRGAPGQISERFVVEGISSARRAGEPRSVTFKVSPVFQQALFTIGDPVLGRLDTGGVLAY